MMRFFRFFLFLNFLIFLCLLCSIFIVDTSKSKKYVDKTINKVIIPRIKFNLNKHVLAFVHIQKTGGSDFDRFLIKNLILNNNQKACRFLSEIKISSLTNPNKKIKKFRKFKCERSISNKSEPSWYFSRQTFGWSCGLHANFNQLKSCISHFYSSLDPKNDFFFFTIIRHPVKRYLSEWKHVARGATWIRKNQKPSCLVDKYIKCFRGGKNWLNVSLNDFMSCEFNLANNRQTKMLSNIKTGCENTSDRTILEEAKINLENMSFFALNEFQVLSQKLFEKMFPEHDKSDMELYKYATNLFFKRLNAYGNLLKSIKIQKSKTCSINDFSLKSLDDAFN
ncbi:heparan-sulfate 6-O-sulfotransferase 3-like [Brachionus plicatilis]|uniref:Heparan-sulfate 6-O-sulfotransferase n=1 Tax=Brachionus plicatilis TaxID=10195 RepID=A0A3M7SX87_BRAPC|nr:heparan-sulfate 6-O-sulfotransferase 3-like [Brachionus plicatilis]